MMDPFMGKNPFSNMGMMNQHPFASDYLDQVQEAMEQYNSVFNDEFWSNVDNVGNQNRARKMTSFPIEMWESDKELFVLAHIPRVKETRQVKISFLSKKRIKIKAKLLSDQPETSKRQLVSELSDPSIERDVTLPYAVKSDSYSTFVDEGVTTLIFEKMEPVPFDF